MKLLLIYFVKKIFWILRLSPILNISVINRFGAPYEYGSTNFDAAISLLHLHSGKMKFFFISYDFHQHKFSTYYVVNLDSLSPWPDKNVIDSAVNILKQKIQHRPPAPVNNTLEEDIANLCILKMESDNESLAAFQERSIFYIGVVLGLIGSFLGALYAFILPFFNDFFRNEKSNIMAAIVLVLSFLLLFSISNMSLFVFHSLKNKTRYRSTLSDFINNATSKLDFIMFDMAAVRKEKEATSNYVLNTEASLIHSVFLFLIMGILAIYNSSNITKQAAQDFNTPEKSFEFSIGNQDNTLEMPQENRSRLLEIMKYPKKIKSVTIISNFEPEDTILKNYLHTFSVLVGREIITETIINSDISDEKFLVVKVETIK